MRTALHGRVAIVTGGGGMLGCEHALALAASGARVVLVDLDRDGLERNRARIEKEHAELAIAHRADVTREDEIRTLRDELVERFGRIDILVNNAARNPSVGAGGAAFPRLRDVDLDEWRRDIEVGLTGALICARTFGEIMERARSGVVLNIASDLAVIAPDQRIYAREGLAPDEQPVKPVGYSVVKTGLLGLTRYLATYWAELGIRVNALSPGGVQTDQHDEFVRKVSERIPLGRMARRDEYRDAVVFLCSDASSYMTGQNLVVDGGRSCW